MASSYGKGSEDLAHDRPRNLYVCAVTSKRPYISASRTIGHLGSLHGRTQHPQPPCFIGFCAFFSVLYVYITLLLNYTRHTCTKYPCHRHDVCQWRIKTLDLEWVGVEGEGANIPTQVHLTWLGLTLILCVYQPFWRSRSSWYWIIIWTLPLGTVSTVTVNRFLVCSPLFTFTNKNNQVLILHQLFLHNDL